jgi:hypothetical protein
MAMGSTQPLTEMSTRNLGKGRPAHKSDNLTAICELIIWRKCRSLDVSHPYGPSGPVPSPYTKLSVASYVVISGCQSHDTSLSEMLGTVYDENV